MITVSCKHILYVLGLKNTVIHFILIFHFTAVVWNGTHNNLQEMPVLYVSYPWKTETYNSDIKGFYFLIFQSFKKSFIGQKMVLWEYDPALQHNILNSQGTMYNKNRNVSAILKS